MKVEISNDLVRGRKQEELQHAVREGLLVRDYLKAEISIGEFSERMGMSYENGRDWLHQRGIATLRRFNDPELERADETNAEMAGKILNDNARK